MAQMIFCQSYDPPKVSMLVPKKFQTIETASTAAATAVVTVYYIKTAKNGSNHVLPELWPHLKLVCYFQKN